jgi:hypothetical protein
VPHWLHAASPVELFCPRLHSQSHRRAGAILGNPWNIFKNYFSQIRLSIAALADVGVKVRSWALATQFDQRST